MKSQKDPRKVIYFTRAFGIYWALRMHVQCLEQHRSHNKYSINVSSCCAGCVDSTQQL